MKNFPGLLALLVGALEAIALAGDSPVTQDVGDTHSIPVPMEVETVVGAHNEHR